MRDVAHAAGVSVATVSKVVNGHYGVSRATSERVTRVIEDLGYVASLGARSLRSHKTHIIGVLVAEFEPFSTELLSSKIARAGSCHRGMPLRWLSLVAGLRGGRTTAPSHVPQTGSVAAPGVSCVATATRGSDVARSAAASR